MNDQVKTNAELIEENSSLKQRIQALEQSESERELEGRVLRDVHWRLESIIEGTHVGTWEWNVQTGKAVFNEVWAEIIGYTLNELAPISIKTWETFAHPDDQKQSAELLELHFSGKLPYYDYEFRMKHKEGHWVWVHDRGRLITRTDDGKPLMMFGTHTDITERKQIEEALRKNREDLRAAHRLAHIGIWHWVADTDTVTWTEDLYRIAGLDPILPAPTYAEHSNIYAPESWDRLKSAVEKALETDTSYQLELKLIRPDGATRWVNAFGGTTHNNHGLLTGLQGTVQDITERKLAEEERRLSEARLAEAQAVAKIGSWETDLLNFKVIWSEETYRIFEIDPESFQSSHPGFLAFVHPDDRSKVDAAFTGSIGKHSPNAIEHRIVTPGGIVKFIEERWQIFHDDKGLPTRAVGTCQDITERKRMEKALRDRDKQYHALFEAIADTVFLIDQETGSLLDVNPAATRMYGFNREEFLRMTTTDVSAEPEKTAEATAKPVPFIPLRYHRHKDGSVFPVEITASSLELQGRDTIIATARDITERKRAEEALRESEERYRTLVENASDIVFRTDENGYFTFVNPSALRISGYEEGEIIGKHYKMFIRTDMFKEAITAFANQLINRTKNTYTEYPVLTKEGREVWLGQNTQLIMNEDQVTGFQAVARDITESKLVEKELNDSERRYRELSIVDDLTQLYNSRYFYHQLKLEIDRVNRYEEQPLTLLLLDLDDFKQFNDAYGHVEGDNVLTRLGQVIKICLRQTDSAYRYGGEEFTIILPMTTSKDAVITAQRIRTEFKKEKFSPAAATQGDVHVTVSIGLAQYKLQEDTKAFVNRVDQLMYQAKKNGKDRVCSEP